MGRKAVRTFLDSVLGEPLPEADDVSLFDSGILDSFTFARLIRHIERTFGIVVPESDRLPRQFDSVEMIRRYLDARIVG